jgi:hypothetical protein
MVAAGRVVSGVDAGEVDPSCGSWPPQHDLPPGTSQAAKVN